MAVFADQAPNLRGGNAHNKATVTESDTNSSIRRNATSVIARTAAKNSRKDRKVVSARNVGARSTTVRARSPEKVTVSSANVSRAAVSKKVNVGRAAASNVVRMAASGSKYSRAATSQNRARATAVFNDVSKIGGGYASCRDSYATCMDQFCAVANDTYRRCFCSDRFTAFRDTADALETALTMLADFQDNNLNAVDKTAEEVNAMYSASEGEAAIKRDTSASQKLLDSIADVLSGKKKTTKKSSATLANMSVGVLDLGSFGGTSSDDIWGGSSSTFSDNANSIFNTRSNVETNLSEMEGAELYSNANRQCMEITRGECNSDAMFNLARSAYSIMITQDCNLYEKNIDAKKESVQQTVRTAEKYLREARLEEYRAHNSKDVNDCLNKVETAIKQPTACGPNYEKCLDYTGRYINMTTGEPIYSKALFGLNDLIVLNGSADVLSANEGFNTFLDERKMFVTQALDSCRSIADTVWYEFKRTALIQIAQAQDAKIEEVKASCVQTMKSCYDEQTGALNELATESVSSTTGALSAIAAHDMCKDQVLACAALYGNPDSCVYDDKTKTVKDKDGGCGLKSLLAYVNTVDSVKVSQGCETSLREYAQELCASSDENHEYPWGCRLISFGKVKALLAERAELFCGQKLIVDVEKENEKEAATAAATQAQAAAIAATASTTAVQNDKAAMHNHVYSRAAINTGTTVTGGASTNLRNVDQNLVTGITDPEVVIDKIANEIKRDIQAELNKVCYSVAGEGQLLWVENTSGAGFTAGDTLKMSSSWMKTVFGTDSDLSMLDKDHYGVQGFKVTVPKTGNTLTTGSGSWVSFGWGGCVQPSVKLMCGLQNVGTKKTTKDTSKIKKNKDKRQ
ncbi:MAG: hypothetical protein MJ165_00675 [Alphaproteobacteria bacterium]|nr:hypothetical protein [Alphaproteobacteria bacterium]